MESTDSCRPGATAISGSAEQIEEEGGDLKGEYCVPVYPLDPSSELKSPVSCLYPQPCIRSIPYLNLPLTLPYLTIKENPLTDLFIPF